MINGVVEMLVPNGDPNGLRIVKLAGWIGRAFIVPRADIAKISHLREAKYPAVYFLFGEGEDKPIVYVGQTDNFERRLNQQSVAKDYWNVALVFTGESDIDVQYLEKICAKHAEEAGRYEIKNSTSAPGRSISDFQLAAHDDFFFKMKFVVSLLGYPLFQPIQAESKAGMTYHLKEATGNVEASGTLLDTGEFIVFKGSRARIKETPAFIQHVRSIHNLRRRLNEDGIIKNDGQNYVFVRDHIFHSPSQASATVAAQARNGWTSWKDQNGKTLDENVRQ